MEAGTTVHGHVVEIKGLVKSFGDRRAVDGVDLTLSQGECVALLGPNGAGKTTTIKVLLGLVRPTLGQLKVFGLSIPASLGRIKARTGVAPQTDNLDPDLSVMENLLIYASYFGMSMAEARDRGRELLKFFALYNRSEEVIGNLSGGQRRRLLIARALINRPELIILDEPTIGLDPQARNLIWDRLAQLRRQGTTMLLTSHYMEEVSRLAGRVVILDQGRVLRQGVIDEMVRELVGDEVLEVSGRNSGIDHLKEMVKGCDARAEEVGDRVYIYTRGECPGLKDLALSRRHVTRRPANLEDLFLKLTGRTLREE